MFCFVLFLYLFFCCLLLLEKSHVGHLPVWWQKHQWGWHSDVVQWNPQAQYWWVGCCREVKTDSCKSEELKSVNTSHCVSAAKTKWKVPLYVGIPPTRRHGHTAFILHSHVSKNKIYYYRGFFYYYCDVRWNKVLFLCLLDWQLYVFGGKNEEQNFNDLKVMKLINPSERQPGTL